VEENSRFMQLFSRDGDQAWRNFLDQYSSMILRCIHARIRQYDDVMQVYISICEKLSAHNYRVMKQFQGRRKSKLSTWLVVIIRSHCADWYRTRMGRKRYFRSLQKLPSIHRLAYKYYYWENLNAGEIEEKLKAISTGKFIGHKDISRILASVNRALGSQNIWRSSVSNRFGLIHPARFDEEILSHGHPGAEKRLCAMSSTERNCLIRESAAAMENILSFLNRDEKLMLRLFYWENKTAKSIASILNFDNEFMAYQRREGLLKRIKKSLEKLGLSFSDFSSIIHKIKIKIGD